MLPFSGLLGSRRPSPNSAAPGDYVFAPTDGGTYDFPVPDGVYALSALAIGRSGRGNGTISNVVAEYNGGDGGDLRWSNLIPVTPGEILRLSIPASPTAIGGTPATATTITRLSTGEVLLSARSGRGGLRQTDSQVSTPFGSRPDGSFVGGGNGGKGGTAVPGNGTRGLGGGGGAGGYSGNGGNGGSNSSSDRTNGAGGAAAGGDGYAYVANANWASFGGGGVGLYGEGASGTGSGFGGSGGARGDQTAVAKQGALYGGGNQAYYGGSNRTDPSARGAIRLVWGTGENNGGRAFPASNVSTSTA